MIFFTFFCNTCGGGGVVEINYGKKTNQSVSLLVIVANLGDLVAGTFPSRPFMIALTLRLLGSGVYLLMSSDYHIWNLISAP